MRLASIGTRPNADAHPAYEYGHIRRLAVSRDPSRSPSFEPRALSDGGKVDTWLTYWNDKDGMHTCRKTFTVDSKEH